MRENFPTISTHRDPVTAFSWSFVLDKPFLNQTYEEKAYQLHWQWAVASNFSLSI